MATNHDPQLSLLGERLDQDPPSPPSRGELRWARHGPRARLGFGSLDVDADALARSGGASIALIVAPEPGPWREADDLQVRHLPLPLDDSEAERHLAALVADARAGRRVAVLSKDQTLSAFLVGVALVELGHDAHEATIALGGRGALGPARHDALVARAAARGRQRRAESAPRFARATSSDPLAGLDGRDARIVATVLGAAIGDAMGHPTEFVRSFEEIHAKWPPSGVTDYVLLWDGVAPYTDDTQMAEQVLRSLIWARERGADLDQTMKDLASRFVAWSKDPQGGHRAPGNACLAGCRALADGVAWHEAGGERAGGCGSVMRAYPFGLLFVDDLERAETWSIAHSRLTHRDPIALAACAAMAVGVARTLRGEPLMTVVSEMIAAACRQSPRTGEMMARALREAEEGAPPEVTLSRLEGWAAHEAIAAAVYLVARHPEDPRAAILEAANTPGDSDSLATLAGALVGARVGVDAIPRSWIDRLERSAELITLARSAG